MRYGRIAIGLAALCASLLCQAAARADHSAAAGVAAGPGGSDTAAWTVIFRSDDPKLWNTNAGNPWLRNGFARALDRGGEQVGYLRLRRMDSGDAVIVAMGRKQLSLDTADLDSELIWVGNAGVRGRRGHQYKLLGIARRSWATQNEQDDLVAPAPHMRNAGFGGWGFSKAASSDPSQSYSWAGQRIAKTVFEIAVKGGDLTNEEQLLLLSFKPNGQRSPQKGPGKEPNADSSVTDEQGGDGHESLNSRPTTRPAKLQTSIEALYVVPQDSGAMLGLGSRFILTATPGSPEGSTPVSFTTPVGPEMHMVLDDVLRAINLKYGVSDVSKVELSFEDKYTAKDGGSIGAAIGTLILSMIQGFDIDPHLAITGDVSADGKICRIGGVAAKLRGAAEAQCKLVAVPAGNYEQVQDALAYEGPGIVTRVQVLGIADLEDAMAIARVDRDAKLAQAIDLFGQVQQAIDKSPDYIYSKAALAKLTQVLTLAPNHYSAKLLLLVNERKLPRLSARASEYYTFVAVQSTWGSLYVDPQLGAVLLSPSAATDVTLKELHKVRPLADPNIQPYIDAWIDFIQAFDQFRVGRTNEFRVSSPNQWRIVQNKYTALLNEGIKLDANRDLAEKMMHEGI